jgi:Fe-S-cluster-containing dehydrogenase component
VTWRIADQPSVCIGCLACTVACMQRKGLPAGCSLIQIKVTESAGAPYDLTCAITHCRHCADPACLAACPSQAIEQEADGTVTFLPRLCTGCGDCAAACPYDAVRLLPDSGIALACDLCRTNGGEPDPACVRHCPSGALELVASA